MNLRWNSDPFRVDATRSLIHLPDGSLLGAHARPHQDGVAVVAVRSKDSGKTWTETGVIVSDPEADTDIGDGSLLRTRSGEILYTFRQHHYRGKHEKTPDYAIRVATSKDGAVWEPHSTVAAHTRTDNKGPSQGFWAPCIFETPTGRLQCYYDDEKTPLESGFPGHQWFVSRTWDNRQKSWGEQTIVSRANGKDLSRDGMGTVVALPKGRLLCALESVQVKPPHANVVRYVTSDDDGRTWSWMRQERGVLYQPQNTKFAALSPFLTRFSDGTLYCIFCTDEEEKVPNRPGCPPPQAFLRTKLTQSKDNGKTWSRPEPVSAGHRTYLPGIVELDANELLAVWIDFEARGTWGRTAKWK